MRQTAGEIDAWNDAVAADCDIEKANKTKTGPIAFAKQAVAGIGEALAPFGIKGTQTE